TVQASTTVSSTNLTSGQTTVVWRNTVPQPPTGSLALSPVIVQPMPVGGQQSFTVLASDANGQPLSGVSVSLVITKIPYEYLYATTDGTGQASFVYQGSA